MNQRIGTIKLGDVTFLSDPCYGTQSPNNCTIETISGEYLVFISRSESNENQGNLTSIYAINKEFYKTHKNIPKNDIEGLWCGVENGMCGIFDKKYYDENHTENDVDDEWFDKYLNNEQEYSFTESNGVFAKIDKDCICYVYAEYQNGKAFAIRIKID